MQNAVDSLKDKSVVLLNSREEFDRLLDLIPVNQRYEETDLADLGVPNFANVPSKLHALVQEHGVFNVLVWNGYSQRYAESSGQPMQTWKSRAEV